jgi:hypothetical protein
MRWVERAPSVNEGGASIVLTYTATLPPGGTVQRTVEAIVLARKPFRAMPLAEPRPDKVVRTAAQNSRHEPAPVPPEAAQNSRHEPAPAPPEQEAPPAKPSGGSGVGWLIGIVLLLAAVVFVCRVFRAPRRLNLKVNGKYVDTSNKALGEAIVTLVGEGLNEQGTVIIEGMPAAELITIRKASRGIQLEKGEKVDAFRIDGEEVHGSTYQLADSKEYNVEIEVKDQSHGVPQTRHAYIKIELDRS